MGQPHFMINGVPTAMLFFLATMFALAFVGDLRIIRFGAPREAAPLAHVLRSVQRRRIILLDPRARRQNPSPSRSSPAPMRVLPILLIFLVMFYWLWRLRTGRSATSA